MSFDEALAERCRKILKGEPALTERKMFGGLSFLVGGKMVCGVLGEKLVLRMDPGDAYTGALKKPHVKPMDFTGRPMRGFVYVLPEGLTRGTALRNWLRAALTYRRALPSKQSGPYKSLKRKSAKTGGLY